jgi:2-phospho-L-lactate guanylyltransferase (CobY/MobA/RfbA family)
MLLFDNSLSGLIILIQDIPAITGQCHITDIERGEEEIVVPGKGGSTFGLWR